MGLKEVETPKNFRQSAHESAQPYAPAFFITPGDIRWYSFLLEAESTPGP
jgi:hypothetical protein